jgi:hypothetical protein
MFIPNSPRPPRGIAVSVCVGLLKKYCSPVWNLKSYHTAKLALLFLAVSLLLEAFHGAVFSSNSPPVLPSYIPRNGTLSARIVPASAPLPVASPDSEKLFAGTIVSLSWEDQL